MIDYFEASTTYDNTRSASSRIIELMARRGVFAPRPAGARPGEAGPRRPRVLDFGCGTGNYLAQLARLFDCDLFGLEPSEGMLEKAVAKNPGLRIVKGDHSSLPFEDGFFDFVYMTDVVHHVTDLDLLFETLRSKLAPGGLACVVTESWEQIGSRWYNAYFPSLARNERSRYPDIGEIAHRAAMAGFGRSEAEILEHPGPHLLDSSFLLIVGEKNYSMFRLLGEDEYEAGYEAMLRDEGRTFLSPGAGETLLWLERGGA